MRFGFWLPVFGGWLRNVEDEAMEASWEYVRDLTRRAEELGFDSTLIAELNLNDIKGEEAPSLHAWSTAAALAAVTERIELMVAVRPSFHNPAIFAKEAANIDRISGGRLALNVVSSWWETEARKFAIDFDPHADRYRRTEEWLRVVDGLWNESGFTWSGDYYSIEGGVVEPKPLQRPRPRIYAGGESETGRETIARNADAWLTHGDPPEILAEKYRDMSLRRERLGLDPMPFGVAGFVVLRDTVEEAQAEVARVTDVRASARGYANYQDFVSHSKLDREVSIEDYSVSNRGLRTGLVGTPDQVAERLLELERAGVELVLLQFSPQMEEMERFAEQVIPRVRGAAGRITSTA